MNKLKILGFIGPLLSKKEDIRAFAELCFNEEVSRRGIERGHEESQFLDFGFGGATGDMLLQTNPHRATSCSLSKAIEGCKSAGITLKRTDNSFTIIHNEEEWKISNNKNAATIINNIEQKELLDSIRENLSHGHSFTGCTTKASHSYRGAKASVSIESKSSRPHWGSST